MTRTRRASAGLMSASMSRWRFRLVVLEVRMCLLKARLRFTFPVEERRKRLAAPFFVFIFGIDFPLSFRCRRRQAGGRRGSHGGAPPLLWRPDHVQERSFLPRLRFPQAVFTALPPNAL